MYSDDSLGIIPPKEVQIDNNRESETDIDLNASREGSYVSSVGTVEKFEQALDKGDFKEALELSTLQDV